MTKNKPVSENTQKKRTKAIKEYLTKSLTGIESMIAEERKLRKKARMRQFMQNNLRYWLERIQQTVDSLKTDMKTEFPAEEDAKEIDVFFSGSLSESTIPSTITNVIQTCTRSALNYNYDYLKDIERHSEQIRKIKEDRAILQEFETEYLEPYLQQNSPNMFDRFYSYGVHCPIDRRILDFMRHFHREPAPDAEPQIVVVPEQIE